MNIYNCSISWQYEGCVRKFLKSACQFDDNEMKKACAIFLHVYSQTKFPHFPTTQYKL